MNCRLADWLARGKTHGLCSFLLLPTGKLPLMELEAEGAEAIKLLKGVDCLTIFLAPPSIDAHEQRLKQWATESDEEIAERQEVAAAEMEAVQSSSVYDQVGSTLDPLTPSRDRVKYHSPTDFAYGGLLMVASFVNVGQLNQKQLGVILSRISCFLFDSR